jgi:hypothetical protein
MLYFVTLRKWYRAWQPSRSRPRSSLRKFLPQVLNNKDVTRCSHKGRLVHSIITKQGQAQDIILKRLAHIMGPGRDTWDEQSPMKEVISHSHYIFSLMQS